MATLRLGGGLQGLDKVRKALERTATKYPGAVARALYQQGQIVQADAVKRAPVEFGVLRSSAYTSPPMGEGKDVSVDVGFGTVYAAAQHEGLDFEHPRGGEARYLANALEAKASLDTVAALATENIKADRKVATLARRQARKLERAKDRAKKRRKKQRAKDRAKATRNLKRRLGKAVKGFVSKAKKATRRRRRRRGT